MKFLFLLSLIILQVIDGSHFCKYLKIKSPRTVNEPTVCKSEIMAFKDDLRKEKFIIPKKQDSIKGKLTDLSATFQKSIKNSMECLKTNQKTSKRRRFFQRFIFQRNAVPYAPTFYVNENLIGYTGDFYLNPTIYYLSNIFGGNINGQPIDKWILGTNCFYGRVTQVYPDDITNVGRNKVRKAAIYMISNRIVDDVMKSIEF